MTASSLRALMILLAAAASAAKAQDDVSSRSVYDGDYLTVGAGIGYGPSYEGSDDDVVFPVGAINGRLGGIAITARPAGLALDLIPDRKDAKVGFSLGPVVRARFDRHSDIRDDVVRRLGKRDIAVEAGANAGITGYRLLNPYDSLTLSADIRWDVAGAHKGRVIAPAISYVTPVSRAAAVILALSAEHVDRDYARYYFSVTPAGSAASGLPVYDAGRGWKNAGGALLATYDLDGDLTNGGFALYGGVSYARLLGDARRSPIVSDRGSANQVVGMIGVGYTF